MPAVAAVAYVQQRPCLIEAGGLALIIAVRYGTSIVSG